ncbi:MAG: ABC transporter ATP-binding protein, partial [Gemmatimonadales bacterium]
LDRLDKSARAGRVVEVLRQVDLAGFESRDVTELSGGQQQRVAVARALAPQPEVLLLDEPLSNLDPTLRERTRMELRDSLKSIGITTVFVTHEQEEAFALGDQIAVLRDGRLEQTGTATDLYEQPRTRFVATFVGRASVLQGVMTGPAQATTGANVVWPVRPTTTLVQGQRVDLVCRPEALRFTDDEGLPGVVVHRRFTGARAYFGVTTDLGEVEVESSAHAAQEGDTVRVAAEFVHAFPSTG